MMTSSRPPTPCTTSATSAIASVASDVLRRALAWLCPSAAETTYSIVSKPAAVARRAPLGLATSADQSGPGRPRTYDPTSAASAIAGTARGETNAVASIRRTPVATSASSSRRFASMPIGSSICSPSRGPTSRMSTAAGQVRLIEHSPDL